jgi:hypothetical protein
MTEKTPKAEDRSEIEPELYEGLGKVIVAWASVEALLAEFLSFLIPADPGGMYVLNQTVSVEMKLKWVRTLCDIRFTDPNTTSRLDDLFLRTEEARIERNAYAHGLWSTLCPPGTVLIHSVNLNRAEIIRQELTTRADFDDLVVRIDEIVRELVMLSRKLGFGPP